MESIPGPHKHLKIRARYSSFVLHDKKLFSIGRTLRVETTIATRTKETRWWTHATFTPRLQELGTFITDYVVLAALFSRALRGLALSVTSFLCRRLCNLSCLLEVAGKTNQIGSANTNLQRIKSRLEKLLIIYSGAFLGRNMPDILLFFFNRDFHKKSAIWEMCDSKPLIAVCTVTRYTK